MLKAVFIGSKNEFDQMLVHWLAQRTELVGIVWTTSTAWQRSWKGRIDFARKRSRRYGPLKVLDEALLHLYYRAFVNRGDFAELQRRVVEPYWSRHDRTGRKPRAMAAASVNAPDVLDFVRNAAPDLVLAMCINEYFGRELRAIPRLGVFLWHEGITPEYKGLYSPFWAIHNQDFDRVGYTLLRMEIATTPARSSCRGRRAMSIRCGTVRPTLAIKRSGTACPPSNRRSPRSKAGPLNRSVVLTRSPATTPIPACLISFGSACASVDGSARREAPMASCRR